MFKDLPVKRMEDYGYIIDVLPEGRSDNINREPLVYIIGEIYFTLLEAVPKPDAQLKTLEKIYIGKGDRDRIMRIKRRVNFNDLTPAAKDEIKEAVLLIVKGNEKRFVDFFNKSGSLNIRQHSIELLPGVGKKHMKDILEKREEKPFESFADISARVSLLPDPVRIISERIIEEIKGETKHYLFAKPPSTYM